MISNFCIANNISHKLLTINQLLAFYIISYYTLPSVKTTDNGGDPSIWNKQSAMSLSGGTFPDFRNNYHD